MTEPGPPVLDPAVTGPLRALGPGVLHRLGATWSADAATRLAALRTAPDAEAARRAAHALKGGSAGLGLLRVRDAAAVVERSAAAGSLPTPSDLQELAALVAEAERALEQEPG